MGIVIRDMTDDDEYYVGTCTHVNVGGIWIKCLLKMS